jgi:S1-C subfamily serine protease
MCLLRPLAGGVLKRRQHRPCGGVRGAGAEIGGQQAAGVVSQALAGTKRFAADPTKQIGVLKMFFGLPTKLLKWLTTKVLALPEVGSLVIVGGRRGGCSAGKVLSVKRESTEKDPFLQIEHTSPVVRGDSGGPLTTPEGQLLGITSAFTTKDMSITYDSTLATSIDAKMLQKAIEEDMAKRSAETQPKPHL